MHLKRLLSFMLILIELSLSAQTQTWQWVKAGGSSSDNNSVQPAECKIAGCDAKGNVYAVGDVNGPNMLFDTFSSAGSYSVTNTGGSYLLFSYDCSGNMRWAKQIGDEEGDFIDIGAVTDPYGYTYLAAQFYYGYNGGLVRLFLGDSVIFPSPPIRTLPYLCMAKFDSLGNLVWFKNFEEDTGVTSHSGKAEPYGLRIGSSGNLWMTTYLDSDYAISPNLHTTKPGRYNVEVGPDSGNILGGYYIAQNVVFGDAYSVDTYHDLDENENYYETGTLVGDFGGGGDTLILANQRIAPDTSKTYVEPYIFSLDKNGNFRYIITNKSYSSNGYFRSCKYEFVSNRLITVWGLDTSAIFGNDTFNFDPVNVGNYPATNGLFSIDANGNILWGKYVTKYVNGQGGFAGYLPTAYYPDGLANTGLSIYDNTDTFFNTTNTSATNYYTTICQIDPNGNLVAAHAANIGAVGSFLGNNGVKYGATDWRGNVYLGGTVTNFFATPADSAVNTDSQSGNFFIAKLGISDCSCPTPGVQFTQMIVGDTVFFFGSSLNHSDSIRWRLGDGGISSSDTFFHVYTNHDSTYSVTAIAYSGCGVDSMTKLITVTSVGIKTVEPNQTALYPNPATSSVNIDISGPATIGLVYANGSSVWNSPVQVSQQGTYVFDMSKYSCAMYYFIVKYTNGKTDVMQVVKE